MMRRALITAELRRSKTTRDEFLLRPRRPITVVLDGVSRNYNIGAIFRLCDAFLVEQLVICGAKVELHKRRLVQAAQGTQHWVLWSARQHAIEAVTDAKAQSSWVVVAEQTTASVQPEQLLPKFPACLVLGGERRGASSQVVETADAAVAIPMLGMANSLNVATAAAILLYWLSVGFEDGAEISRQSSAEDASKAMAAITAAVSSGELTQARRVDIERDRCPRKSHRGQRVRRLVAIAQRLNALDASL